MPEALLQVQSLRCERDERVLFDELSFDVAPGQRVRVDGANGAGKTTLLRAIAGLSTRCSGQIRWRGVDCRRDPLQFRSQMLFLGHEAGVKLPLSPLENLTWSMSLCASQPSREDYCSALERLDLGSYASTPCQFLSAGQRRRVGLARLLLSPAQMWILDEPFTAIDSGGVEIIEAVLAEHTAGDGLLLLTSHQALQDEADMMQITLGVGA